MTKPISATILICIGLASMACQRESPAKILGELESLRLQHQERSSEQAIQQYLLAIERWRSEDVRHAAEAAHGLARTYQQLGRLSEAGRAFSDALALAERSGDALEESTIRSELGYVQAWLSERATDLDAAEGLCREALATARERGAAREEAKALECLGEVVYFRGGDFEQALKIQAQAEALWQRLGNRAGVAQAKYAQGYLYSDLRRFDRARAAFDEARSLWNVLGDSRGLAITLVAEARLLERRGEYQESLDGYKQALALLEPMGDAIWSGSCLAGQAQVYQYLADAPKALDYFLKALRVAESSGLKTFEWDMLNNVGAASLASGDQPAAVENFQKAYTLGVELANPRQQAWALTYLGGARLAQGAVAQARESFERARSLLIGIDEPWLLAQTLTGLGNSSDAVGDSGKAIEYFEEAVRVSEAAGDRQHAAANKLALGRVAARQGQLVSASATVSSALAEYTGLLTAEHPLVAETKATLANVDFWRGRVGEAVDAAAAAAEMSLEHLRATLRYLPERQALAFASKQLPALDLAVSSAVASPSRFGARVYELIIRSRGSVLDELAARNRISGTGNENGTLSAAVLHARQRYANLLVRSFEGTVPSTEFEAARGEKEALERTLAAQNANVRSELARTSVGIDSIRAALPKGGVLISFVQFARYRRPVGAQAPLPAVPSLAAFVIRNDRPLITVTELGAVGEIEPLIENWRREAAGERLLAGRPSSETEATVRRVGESLRRAVWDPLSSHIRGATRILVVPDGMLGLVPIAALPTGTDAFLAETEPPIQYLTTERDVLLAGSGTRPPQNAGLLALGGPDFDADVLQAGSSGSANRSETSTEATLRAAATPCGSLQALQFSSLSGTVDEVEQVARMVEEPGASARTLIGRDASETEFKREASHYRILHLATHGFFLDGACAPSSQRSSAATRGVGGLASNPRVDNPLLLSGLALAGANHRAQARADEDDGILTAEEVASLDLSGTEWAVLSACDTGVGEIKAGEGVFGLRRAFQIAGARTVIMSLWSVDDQSTRAWMRALYEGRFQRHLSTADAVHQASLSVLRDRRARGLSTHPFFWAAFVAAGDWR